MSTTTSNPSNPVTTPAAEDSPSSTLFLDELDKAEQKCFLFLWSSFLSPQDAEDTFQSLDSKFPWNLNPRIAGEKLNQHAYYFDRTNSKNNSNKKKNDTSPPPEGLVRLEELCVSIENRFDVKVWDVFCNRFQDPQHDISWHSDTYGSHIFVLTLGSERDIQFRPKRRSSKQKGSDEDVSTIRPGLGDIYFMPLALNNTHVHRVCAADSGDGQVSSRISLVFFVKPPAYAKDYKISVADKLRGAFLGGLEQLLS